jgi:HD superfamily phosphodiesterase
MTTRDDIANAFVKELVEELSNRIEPLEAALRRIRDDGKNCVDHCRRQADKALRISARAALDKDTGE